MVCNTIRYARFALPSAKDQYGAVHTGPPVDWYTSRTARYRVVPLKSTISDQFRLILAEGGRKTKREKPGARRRSVARGRFLLPVRGEGTRRPSQFPEHKGHSLVLSCSHYSSSMITVSGTGPISVICWTDTYQSVLEYRHSMPVCTGVSEKKKKREKKKGRWRNEEGEKNKRKKKNEEVLDKEEEERWECTWEE
ncbi:hypothetical protein GW17_00002656 [Ensete ventricosum]|nr:hypothetical protein GW17_00002656 [Ensete ventricosum]